MRNLDLDANALGSFLPSFLAICSNVFPRRCSLSKTVTRLAMTEAEAKQIEVKVEESLETSLDWTCMRRFQAAF